ncbi:MAG: hypothetical protein E7604_03375 [Ruminococcaceae bacterium]|nr:hypothetical protein [Oscillospiraceae bacterium]
MAKTRLTALLLLLSMLFFCACESGAAGTADTGAAVTDGGAGGIGGAASDTVVTTLADREDPEAEYITTLKTYDMRPVEPAVNMYSTFQYVDGDYFYASIKPYPQKELCCFDRDGGLVWSRAIPDHEDGAEMYAVVLPDDRMIVVYNRINQVKEGFLCLYDADGTLLQTTPVPEGCKINTTQFQAKILPGEDGGIRVVMLVTTAMLVLDGDLNLLQTIFMEGAMDYMTHRGGDLFWVGYGVNLFEVDIAAGTKVPLEEHPYQLGDAVNGDLYFDGDGNAYYGDRVGVYAVDETGVREPILEWLNGRGTAGRLYMIDRERLYVFQPKALGNVYEYQLIDCTKTEAFSAPRRVITLAALTFPDAFLKETIQLFNAENERYYIRLTDYSTYGQAADIERVFDEHLMAGDVPDMLVMSSAFNIGKYAEKNLTADLLPTFGDALLGGVRHAVLDGGRMWTLPTRMTVQTFAAASSVTNGPLTMDTFYALAENLSGKGTQAEVEPDSGMRVETNENGDMVLVQYPTAEQNSDVPFEGEVIAADHTAIRQIFENGLYDFVDYENRTASFDTEEFRRFIEYLRLVDEEYVHINAGRLQSYGYLGYESDSSYLRENLADGRLQLLSVSFDDIGLYPALKRLFGDGEIPFTLCGYPTASGGCSAYIRTPSLLSVMADSTVHGGCAEFISFLLSDRVQTSDKLIEQSLPVTLSGLEAAIDRYRYFYYVREGVQPMVPAAISDVPLEDYKTGFSETYNIEVVITDEDKAAMLDFFENCRMQAGSDPVIADIVEEELSYWYGGAKTLEETTKIIQSRVWIYLNE